MGRREDHSDPGRVVGNPETTSDSTVQVPGKRAYRTSEVLVRPMSGNATNRDLARELV
jgi:hypothetical protein